jgi:hypothetical protein
MFLSVLSWLLEFWLSSWLAKKILPSREQIMAVTVGDRFEKPASGIPIMQGRVTRIVEEHGVQLLTIDWDDGTRTTGKLEDVLRSSRHIHPLAPRLEPLAGRKKSL